MNVGSNPTRASSFMKCKDCNERATYSFPNLEASKEQKVYMVDYFCDYHGPLAYIKISISEPNGAATPERVS